MVSEGEDSVVSVREKPIVSETEVMERLRKACDQ